MSVSVLFVCLGNICRSPTAHGVFEKMVADNELQHLIAVDSAGTAGWHIGKLPDERSSTAAMSKGYDLSHIRSRQVCAEDFTHFDYILAMDKSNLQDLRAVQPNQSPASLSLFLSFAEAVAETEVPDPYYGDGQGFQRVLTMAEQAAAALLDHIIDAHDLS